jgi:hypothetical protein
MDEPNPNEAHRTTAGGSLAEGPRWRLDILIRRILIAVGLAAVGLIATPIGIFLSGSILFFWRQFPDVAQGFYSALTIFGILLAPLGALYWFVVGAWLSGRGRVGQPTENRGAPWGTIITVYVACLVVVAAFIGFSR